MSFHVTEALLVDEENDFFKGSVALLKDEEEEELIDIKEEIYKDMSSPKETIETSPGKKLIFLY